MKNQIRAVLADLCAIILMALFFLLLWVATPGNPKEFEESWDIPIEVSSRSEVNN